MNPRPVVLCFSGHDPGGGAGLQADIEAIAAQGAFAATVPTCLTEQDSQRVYRVHPLDAAVMHQTAQRILDDYPVAALKIGLIGSPAAASIIGDILKQHPELPVVLDPVLHSGSGQALAATEYLLPLLPWCAMVTPNRAEARALSGSLESLEICASALLQAGADGVLITGADESEHGQVINSLYQPNDQRHWRWPKLAGSYHGSGCTLAASLAARLALGENLATACDQAQRYTYGTLQQAFRPGQGQWIPQRWSCTPD